MTTDKLRMRLNIMKNEDYKTLITLKSKRIEPFVAKVDHFDYEEEDSRVILKRCKETVFPNDTKNDATEHYTLYIKDIKSVELFEEN